MDKLLQQGLVAFIVVCLILMIYLAVVIQEGPKPPHVLRQSLLDGRQIATAQVIYGPGALNEAANQDNPDIRFAKHSANK